MSLRLAILCPGQGAQHGAMFDALQAHRQAAAFLAGCGLDHALQQPLATVLADPAALFANRHAQPLVVAAQLAAWSAVRDGIAELAGTPALVAGYSVGEVSAQAIAGVIALAQAVPLVARRAAAMDQAAQGHAQGLISVGGLPLAQAQACLAANGAHVAIVTGDDTLIAGGLAAALQQAATELTAMGARTGVLPVGLASHTPLMQAAVPLLGAALAQLAPQAPGLPLLAGIDARLLRDGADAQAALLAQLVQPIQWAACMDACAEQGITVALELGPGAALSRMLRERHPHIASRSLADFRSIEGLLGWLRRQGD